MDTPETLIDLDRYPIHQMGGARDDILTRIRADLGRDGCAVLKRFITPEGIEALKTQADGVADKAFRSFNRTNPYFTRDDPNLPASDPRSSILF